MGVAGGFDQQLLRRQGGNDASLVVGGDVGGVQGGPGWLGGVVVDAPPDLPAGIGIVVDESHLLVTAGEGLGGMHAGRAGTDDDDVIAMHFRPPHR